MANNYMTKNKDKEQKMNFENNNEDVINLLNYLEKKELFYSLTHFGDDVKWITVLLVVFQKIGKNVDISVNLNGCLS